MSFLAELRRRNVVRVGAAYLYDGLMTFPAFDRHRDHPKIRALAPDTG